MADYTLDIIAGLARQLQFTPLETRAAQVVAAENLLLSLDPLKPYPLDFIVFRITGYRPRSGGDEMLTGWALQHDLGLLIEQVSDTLSLTVAAAQEPVLAIEDVAKRFNVTSKTIQRWRRRGLPARRFLFADGKRRVGFYPSSVERFLAVRRAQDGVDADFSEISEAERAEILRRAQVRAKMGWTASEIHRRTARRLNRSLSTIQQILSGEAAEAVLVAAAPEPTDAERAAIARAHHRVLSLKGVARRVGRSRAIVHRVLFEDRLARLDRRKVKFIDDPIYHGDEAEVAIETILGQGDELSSASRPEDSRVPRDLPPDFQTLYRAPLLSPARERALFLAFNYYKFRYAAERKRIKLESVTRRQLDALDARFALACAVKNQIVQANLRLVVSVARKHLRTGLSLMELVSEGNVTLLRAVESFDAHRGHRFSTYATFALMKGFARSVPKMLAGRQQLGAADVGAIADHGREADHRRFLAREELNSLLGRLNRHERDVLHGHYGLGDRGAPQTYEQLAERLGLSKQRVRQIEQSALAKLRGVAPPSLD